MAATNFTPISLYYSATATNVPTAGNLVAGELAINTADGKLFYKDSSNVVQTIASKTAATFPNVNGSTSGAVTLAAPAVAGSNTATFPAATGTVAYTNQVVGQDQTTQTLTGSRTLGTTYTNSTTNTIVVYASISNSVASPITLCSINGTSIQGSAVPTANAYYSVVLIVPPSATYVVNMNGTPTLQQWVETR